MRKIRFIITIILGLFASYAWADGVVDSINHIKRDTTYLYGEGTMPTLERADSLARKELVLKVREWMLRQAELTDSTEIDESRLSPYVSVLTSRRADMIRGFAYIQKADLRRLLNPQDAVHSTIVAKYRRLYHRSYLPERCIEKGFPLSGKTRPFPIRSPDDRSLHHCYKNQILLLCFPSLISPPPGCLCVNILSYTIHEIK